MRRDLILSHWISFLSCAKKEMKGDRLESLLFGACCDVIIFEEGIQILHTLSLQLLRPQGGCVLLCNPRRKMTADSTKENRILTFRIVTISE